MLASICCTRAEAAALNLSCHDCETKTTCYCALPNSLRGWLWTSTIDIGQLRADHDARLYQSEKRCPPARLTPAPPMQDNPLDFTELTTCRYGDTAFPEPGDLVPQQIHIMPAGAPDSRKSAQFRLPHVWDGALRVRVRQGRSRV